MIPSLFRKSRQLLADPVLRRWLIGRARGKYKAPPAFTPHHPPYLNGQPPLALESVTKSDSFNGCETGKPQAPLKMRLPGQTVSVDPADPDALFDQTFSDIETELGVHRFAWLDRPASEIDPAWVNGIWSAWSDRFGDDKTGWPWHPYTASERVINILTFAERYGIPGHKDQTLALLAGHAPVIAAQLEYFGDHDTSNHLANNGRGLFILGLKLGLPRARDLGREILVREAERIFLPSGMLREGSSHYHALYARRYLECAGLAKAHDIAGADKLTDVANRAMGCLAAIRLPGRFPLIGDISPDIAPDDLIASMDLAIDQNPISEDGWLRADLGKWHGLWHASPDGWSQMPGHGHQDCGSFELHWQDEPVFVDAGRGAYGETGVAALYRSALVHNDLMIDDQDPYPPNKPYYAPEFRRDVAGPPPTLKETPDGVALAFDGYRRLRGIGSVERRWQFTDNTMILTDKIAGSGRRTVRRTFVTSLDANLSDGSVALRGERNSYRLQPVGQPVIKPITIWQAYGVGTPGLMISFEEIVTLPWQGETTLEVL